MKGTLYIGIALAGLTLAVPVVPSANAKNASLAAYFPSSSQYPGKYHILPVNTYTDPASVFGDINAKLASRLHFVVGSTSSAFTDQAVITISMGRFRDALGAGRFGARLELSVLHDSLRKSRVISGLGSSGARYVSGTCATCGNTAPLLGQLVFSRGAMFVLVGVQPANVGIAQHLGMVIDTKFRQTHLR